MYMNLILALAISAQAHAAVDSNRLPDSWFRLPEDAPAVQGLVEEKADAAKSKNPTDQMGAYVDRLLAANGEAVDGLEPLAESVAPDPSRPKDWAPWHAEFFMTDLSVSASGLLGVLTAKGTPSVQVMWRRQNEQAKPAGAPLQLAPEGGAEGLVVSDDAPAAEIQTQLEPAVRAIMADGKVRDEAALRKNLLATARDFQTLAASLESDPGLSWWVSRLRLDVIIDANGVVMTTAAGKLYAGAEARFRFDWYRLERARHAAVTTDRALVTMNPKAKSGLVEFVQTMASDLEALSEKSEPSGFQTYQIRVGVGITAGGAVGVAKGSAQVIGNVYFSHNVRKPTVHPPIKSSPTIAVIESAPTREHLAFAEANAIAVESSPGEVVYRVDRAAFRKGLGVAGKMAGFFARRARKSTTSRWKIWEIRPAFDLSVTGSLGVVTVGGVSSVELDMFNENF